LANALTVGGQGLQEDMLFKLLSMNVSTSQQPQIIFEPNVLACAEVLFWVHALASHACGKYQSLKKYRSKASYTGGGQSF
jgi:hypothetical protein